MFQTELPGESIPILQIILPHKPICRVMIIILNIRRQILQNSLACVHGQTSCIYINDSHQVKRICHDVKESLLFPNRIRYVRAHQTDPSQTKVHL